MNLLPASESSTPLATEPAAALEPGAFCRNVLQAMEASEGRRKRRKRDTTPDAVGMALKRDLLGRAAAEAPAAEAFEGWLLEQTLRAPASGPVRAMCTEIWYEYRIAAAHPSFSRWLETGAESDDAAPERGATDGGMAG